MLRRVLKVKRFFILFFAVVFTAVIAAGFSACDADKGGTSSTAVSSDDTVDYGCVLPEIKWGETVTVLALENDGYHLAQWAPEETNDEPVNDATYERNALIKDRYDITIAAIYRDSYDSIIEAIDNEANVFSGAFDVASAAIHYLATSPASQGLLYDLNSVNSLAGVDYLDLSGQWWDQAAVRDLSIAHALFYATGDVCVTDNTATWAIYYNKDIANDNGIENLYQTVRDGDWTLDKMYTYAKGATVLVGTQMDFTADTDDTWGIVAESYDTLATMLGCAQPMSVKDENDIPQFRIKEERNLEVFDRVLSMMLDGSHVGMADFFGSWNSGVYVTKTEIFTNGHALFYYGALSAVDSELMRNAEIHYGILPMPKADELQTEYSSSGTVYHLTAVSIPISVEKKLPCTVFALEAMAFYGRELVTDEYYEVTLKNKRFTDDDSPEMLDIIVSNRTYDLSTVYNWGDALYMYTTQLGNKNNTLVSAADTYLPKMEVDRDAAVEAIKAFE